MIEYFLDDLLSLTGGYMCNLHDFICLRPHYLVPHCLVYATYFYYAMIFKSPLASREHKRLCHCLLAIITFWLQ